MPSAATSDRHESCDVAIVGARCAGTAAASALAQAGRKVIVLDRAKFPSDTLSTHVFFPSGVDELRRAGALDRVLALDPPRIRRAALSVPGVKWYENFRAIGGTAFGISVPRVLQDVELVAAAREQGADVREGCQVHELIWEGGRVAGVRFADSDGAPGELRAKFVIGADGRRSSIAALVGSWRPYRASRNGRGMVFRYMDDPRAGEWEGETMWQWREGKSVAMAFPCAPGPRLLVLFMGARDEVSEARRDPEGHWQAKLGQHPELAERCAGATNLSKVRSTADTPAYFRASSGPGWALAGDAGHFKDPVIGQGMRDAMWMGRTLAEAIVPLLEDLGEVDAASRRWEHARDIECLPAYHWANSETRVRDVSPLFSAALALFPVDGQEPSISDTFSRLRNLPDVLTPSVKLRAAAAALRRNGLGAVREIVSEGRIDRQIGAEARNRRFRSTRPIRGSEHPGAPWPKAPRLAAKAPASANEAELATSLEVG